MFSEHEAFHLYAHLILSLQFSGSFFFFSHQLTLKQNSHFTSSPEIGFMFNLRLEENFNQVTSHPHECHFCVDVLMLKQH